MKNKNSNFFVFKGSPFASYPEADLCGDAWLRPPWEIGDPMKHNLVVISSPYPPRFLRIHRPITCWPDILTVSCSSLCPVNDRIIQDLHDAGITEFNAHPVPIIDVPAKKMPPWKYWLIEPRYGTAKYHPVFDEYIRENNNELIDRRTGKLNEQKFGYGSLPFPRYELDHNVLIPYDIVWTFKNDFRRCTVGYSERIIDLAREKGWTNCWFENFENYASVVHEAPDWREQLILKNQEKDDERHKAIQEYYNRLEMEKGRGVSLDNIPIPETPKPVERPEYYPFKEYDNAFGEYLRIYLSSPLLFGEGWFDIDFDGKYNEGKAFCHYILTPEQCAFYKYFIDRTDRLIPEIKRVLLDQLRVIQKDHPEITPPVDVPDFCTLAEWVTNPEIFMFEPPTETGGEISLTYEVMGTDLIVLVSCHFIFVADSVEVTGKIVEKE